MRSQTWPEHSSPHILQIGVYDPLEPEELSKTVVRASRFAQQTDIELSSLSITNSFGMPSQPPDIWQADMAIAVGSAGPGQALVASVTGTPEPGGDAGTFAKDYARTAAMCVETGAHGIEVNLSCPNIGGTQLLCQDVEAARDICKIVKRTVGSVPLFAKLGYYGSDEVGVAALRNFVIATAPFLEGYSAINAIPVTVLDDSGNPALPGIGRTRAGVCGAILRLTGLDLVRRLAKLRFSRKYDYAIIGVGGVACCEDYYAYKDAGADAVQAATASIWNPSFAIEIAGELELALVRAS